MWHVRQWPAWPGCAMGSEIDRTVHTDVRLPVPPFFAVTLLGRLSIAPLQE